MMAFWKSSCPDYLDVGSGRTSSSCSPNDGVCWKLTRDVSISTSLLGVIPGGANVTSQSMPLVSSGFCVTPYKPWNGSGAWSLPSVIREAGSMTDRFMWDRRWAELHRVIFGFGCFFSSPVSVIPPMLHFGISFVYPSQICQINNSCLMCS